MNQLENKMEDFLTSASEVLCNIKKEQEESKKLQSDSRKLLNTIKSIAMIMGIAMIGWMIRIEVGLEKRPIAGEVVSTKDAITVQRLRISNMENIAKTLASNDAQRSTVHQYLQEELRMVETIYNINFN